MKKNNTKPFMLVNISDTILQTCSAFCGKGMLYLLWMPGYIQAVEKAVKIAAETNCNMLKFRKRFPNATEMSHKVMPKFDFLKKSLEKSLKMTFLNTECN